MDVKEAVNVAKNYIADLFRDEGIINLGLEEVEFDDRSSSWNVTIGFSRPWDRRITTIITAFTQQEGSPSRSYKVVRIDDNTKEVRSVKNRETKS
jgi:hypothetical protein